MHGDLEGLGKSNVEYIGVYIRFREAKNPTPPRNSRGMDGGVGSTLMIILIVFEINQN